MLLFLLPDTGVVVVIFCFTHFPAVIVDLFVSFFRGVVVNGFCCRSLLMLYSIVADVVRQYWLSVACASDILYYCCCCELLLLLASFITLVVAVWLSLLSSLAMV